MLFLCTSFDETELAGGVFPILFRGTITKQNESNYSQLERAHLAGHSQIYHCIISIALLQPSIHRPSTPPHPGFDRLYRIHLCLL